MNALSFFVQLKRGLYIFLFYFQTSQWSICFRWGKRCQEQDKSRTNLKTAIMRRNCRLLYFEYFACWESVSAEVLQCVLWNRSHNFRSIGLLYNEAIYRFICLFIYFIYLLICLSVSGRTSAAKKVCISHRSHSTIFTGTANSTTITNFK